MKPSIPFLTSSTETDLILTFALIPLWNILGLNIFIYHAVIGWCFIKWLVSSRPVGGISMGIPKPLIWFAMFLCSYMLSILINIQNQPEQRIFASVNNWLNFLMGFLVALTAYNLRSFSFVKRLLSAAAIVCAISSVAVIGGLILWFCGVKKLTFATIAGYYMPQLMDYPYFVGQLVMPFIQTDFALNNMPRISFFLGAKTATGGFFVLMIPLLVGYYLSAKRNHKVQFTVLLVMSILAMLLSLSRGAVLALIGAFILVQIIDRGRNLHTSLFYLITSLFAANSAIKIFSWMVNMRPSSTSTRMKLYEDAIRIAFENNILMGVGVKIREEFTMTAIGSHSTHIGILLVSGIFGLCFFIAFEIAVFLYWYSLRNAWRDSPMRIIWKYLGASYIGMSIWIMTDGLDAFPYMIYVFFLVIAAILMLKPLALEEERSRAEAGEPVPLPS